jgi:hypothetical protein
MEQKENQPTGLNEGWNKNQPRRKGCKAGSHDGVQATKARYETTGAVMDICLERTRFWAANLRRIEKQ